MTKQHKNPCKTCPFLRTVKPGALGGSEPETFIGQAVANFLVKCHEMIDYSDEEWNRKAREGLDNQCAGLAIYRANNGIECGPLLKLEPDSEKVFGSHAEFFAHHHGISNEKAEEVLMWNTAFKMALAELDNAGTTMVSVEGMRDANRN